MQHLLWVLAALCCSVLQEEPHTIDTIAISAVVTDYAANNSAPNRQLGTTITAAFLACDAWAHFYCHCPTVRSPKAEKFTVTIH